VSLHQPFVEHLPYERLPLHSSYQETYFITSILFTKVRRGQVTGPNLSQDMVMLGFKPRSAYTFVYKAALPASA
jgi:hypothetical protein